MRISSRTWVSDSSHGHGTAKHDGEAEKQRQRALHFDTANCFFMFDKPQYLELLQACNC
jgi:hypothetical protein